MYEMKHFSIVIPMFLENRGVGGPGRMPTLPSHTSLLTGCRDPNTAGCPGAWEKNSAASPSVMTVSSNFCIIEMMTS